MSIRNLIRLILPMLLLLLGCVVCFAIDTTPDNQSEKVSGVKTDLEAIAVQLRLFEMMTGRLPSNKEGISALVDRPAENATNWKQLLYRVPTDPWNHPYQYMQDSGTKYGFTLFSLGPDPQISTDDIFYIPKTAKTSKE